MKTSMAQIRSRAGERRSPAERQPERHGAVPTEPSEGSARRRLRLLLKLFASAAILVYILTIVPIAEILASLRGVDIRYILLGLSVVPAMTYAAAVQQKLLTDRQEMNLSVGKIVEINLVTQFYGLFLPGYLAGGAIRWYRMSRPVNKPAEAAVAIVYNRILETLVVVALGLVFWFVSRPPDSSALLSATLLALFGGLLVLQAALFDRRFAEWVGACVPNRAWGFVPEPIRSGAGRLSSATRRMDSLPRKLRAQLWFLCTARHLLGVLSFVWLALALEIEIGFAAAGWIRSFLTIALLLPISFAGLGVREASLIVMLGVYGVSASSAVALSFVFFARDLLRAAAGGLWEFRNFLRSPRSSVSRTDT